MSVNIISFSSQAEQSNSHAYEGFEPSSPYSNDSQQGMSNIHRSAPHVHGIDKDCLYLNDDNDFIFNSSEQRQDFGYYFQSDNQQLSSQEDDQHLHFQGEDIFDRIQHLNLDHGNSSILQEQDQLNGIQNDQGNQQNPLFESAFDFNLRLSLDDCRPSKILNYHTDRLYLSPNHGNSESRSLQKHKNNFKLQQQILQDACFINQDDNQKLSPLNLFKKKNQTSQKKKFQPFTSYAKQSKILADILPSYNLNESSFNQGSVNCSLKELEKSIIGEQYLSTHENKDKLLRKINKLVGSTANFKRNQVLEKKMPNKQKRELKVKSKVRGQVNKQNIFIHATKQSLGGNLSIEQAKQIISKKQKVRMFKRSSNIENPKISVLFNNKNQHQNSKQLSIKEHSKQSQKLNCHRKFDEKAENTSQNIIQSEKQVFRAIELNQPALLHLSQSLSPAAYEILTQLNIIHLYSAKQSSKQELGSRSQAQSNTGSSNLQASEQHFVYEKEIALRLSILEKQEKQIALIKQSLKEKHSSLKRTLCFSKIADEVNLSSPLGSEKNDIQSLSSVAIRNKKHQIMQSFDLWKEIGL